MVKLSKFIQENPFVDDEAEDDDFVENMDTEDSLHLQLDDGDGMYY